MGFEEAFQAADLAVRAVRADGLRDIERVVLEGSWNRLTYQKIAAEAGYTEGYLSRDVGPALWSILSDALGMQVKKTNFRTAIERWSKAQDDQRGVAAATARPDFTDGEKPATVIEARADPLPFDITDFRGREQALADLTAWIVHDRGRLLCLHGMPGVGKTWLAVKLAQQVQPQFQRLIYRELSDRPSPLELVQALLDELESAANPQVTLKTGLERLVQTLAQRRCLIVLDSVEVFYCPGELAGVYGPDFEAYCQILETLASRDHQSCVMWIGRELSRTVNLMVGSGCRSYALAGFQSDELPALAFWPEELEASEAGWRQISIHYGGLPALIRSEIAPRLAAFGHNLEACFDVVRWENRLLTAYLENWLAPLTEHEQHLLTGLMISHRPRSLTQLSELVGAVASLSVIESLCDRGMCRSTLNGEPQWELSLPDLLIPYLCDRLLASFRTSQVRQIVEQLHRYPLVQAAAPEMVRQWQQQMLLEAVATVLEESLPQVADRVAFLKSAFAISRQLTQQAGATPSYSAGNLVNLARYWQLSLVDWDLQGLKLREADLQSDLFQGISLAGADLAHTLLAKPLGQCPVIAISPNCEQVAVGDQDGRLLLWNLQDGRLQRVMLTVAEAIRTLAFSQDGATLAEGRLDGTVRLWDLGSDYGPELFATLPQGALKTLIFSLDKQLLVGGDDQGVLHVWRLASGETIQAIPAHEASITAIALSPCSRRLVTCGQDCAAIEWDLQTGEPIHRFQGRLTNALGLVAYLPDATESAGRAVVIGQDDGQLVIWDIASARPLRVMNQTSDLIMALALSPDGHYLAASDVSNHVSVWDVNTRSRLYQISESSAPVESLVFSPDGHDLMTGCDYQVQRWQVRSGQCSRSWRSDRHPANKLALANQPLQLLSSHDDHTLRCWQFSSHRQRWLPQERLQIPGDGPISTIATNFQGTFHAVGTEAGDLHVWHREQQAWLNCSMRLPGSITALTLSSEGRLMAAGDAFGTVALWDLHDQSFCWQKPQVHDDRVTALAFAAEGQQIFSGSRDRTIQSWDVQGNPIATLTGHRRRVHTLCLAQTGSALYSGSYDGTVRRWDLTNQTCTQVWQRGDQYIHGVTLNAEQRPVAILSDTQKIELWELDTDICRSTFSFQEEPIWHASTSPDGAALVGAAQNGHISIWLLTTGEQRGQLRVDRPYEGMQIGGCLGLTDSERQMLYSLGATDY